MDTPASTAPAERRGLGLVTPALAAAVAVVAVVFAFSGSADVPNSWYALFKAVHVTFAVIWIGGGTLLTVLGIAAQAKNDPEEIATVARQAATVGEKLFAPAGLIVFLMGVAMLLNTDLGWGHFWIVAGLVGYAATFTTGLFVLTPLAKRITASAAEKGATHPDTIALVDRILLVVRFDVAMLILVVVDMVTKPFA
jgi:uncharacterized membrane protein